MRWHAEEFSTHNLKVAKFAIAAMLLDGDNRALVCYHDGVEGRFEDGAMGSVTETIRYRKSTNEAGEYVDDDVTETPLHALRRCLYEEHLLEDPDLEKAGLYFDRMYPAFLGYWNVGERNGLSVVYPTVNFLIRVSVPEVLERTDRPSEEIVGAEFLPPDVIFDSEAPERPGYKPWLRQMLRFAARPVPRNVKIEINWPEQIATGADTRAPF